MEKVHEAGLRALIKIEDTSLLDSLDKALWAYDSESFIPHGKEGCDHVGDQPILLTPKDENPIEATVLVLINAADSDCVLDYDRCLYMFDGRDEGIVAKAREDWKTFKVLDAEMSYWQQKENGGWEKKA